MKLRNCPFCGGSRHCRWLSRQREGIMRIRLKAKRKERRKEAPTLEISIKTHSRPFELSTVEIKYGKFEAATAVPHVSVDFPRNDKELQAVASSLKKLYISLMERVEDDGK